MRYNIAVVTLHGTVIAGLRMSFFLATIILMRIAGIVGSDDGAGIKSRDKLN